jgi:hypothetical protein
MWRDAQEASLRPIRRSPRIRVTKDYRCSNSIIHPVSHIAGKGYPLHRTCAPIRGECIMPMVGGPDFERDKRSWPHAAGTT